MLLKDMEETLCILLSSLPENEIVKHKTPDTYQATSWKCISLPSAVHV